MGGGGGGGPEDYIGPGIFFRLELNPVYFFGVLSHPGYLFLDDIHVIKMIHTYRLI